MSLPCLDGWGTAYTNYKVKTVLSLNGSMLIVFDLFIRYY